MRSRLEKDMAALKIYSLDEVTDRFIRERNYKKRGI